jgi:hypothetical protein
MANKARMDNRWGCSFGFVTATLTRYPVSTLTPAPAVPALKRSLESPRVGTSAFSIFQSRRHALTRFPMTFGHRHSGHDQRSSVRFGGSFRPLILLIQVGVFWTAPHFPSSATWVRRMSVAVSCFMCVAVEMRCDCTLDSKPGGSGFFELVPRVDE